MVSQKRAGTKKVNAERAHYYQTLSALFVCYSGAMLLATAFTVQVQGVMFAATIVSLMAGIVFLGASKAR